MASKIFQPENEDKTCLQVEKNIGFLDLLKSLLTFVSPFAASRSDKPQARVAQLVERDLAKVEVASSNLVSRSKKDVAHAASFFTFCAGHLHLPEWWNW